MTTKPRAYKIPNANTAETPSFRRVGIRRCHIALRGKKSIAKSDTTLMAADEINATLRSMQCPGTLGFQIFFLVYTVKLTKIIRCVNQYVVPERLGMKICMYCKRMESLLKKIRGA